ncbi:MAG: glycosyltransferase [Candidatus Aminicenantes bacterium]
MLFCDIASFYSPKGGGVLTYHRHKLKAFAQQNKHKYILIAPSYRNQRQNTPGGTIYWLKGFKYDANYYHLYNPLSIRSIINAHRPDFLEFGSPYLDYWAGRLAVFQREVLKTAFYHCDFPDTYLKPFLKKRFKWGEPSLVKLGYKYVKKIYNQLDATFVASPTISDKLTGLGVTNLHLVPLGVDGELFHPEKRDELFRRDLGIKKGEKILLYVGRFRADKGVLRLLDIIPRLSAISSLHVAFVGTGPLETQIAQLSLSNGHVHNLGYVSDRELLAKIYASSDIFISPGSQETFGLGIMEAVASGLPVLSAASGAGADIVSRFQCGLVFDDSKRSDLVKKLKQLLLSRFENNLESARQHLETHHNWDKIFQSYFAYHEKLKEKKG